MGLRASYRPARSYRYRISTPAQRSLCFRLGDPRIAGHLAASFISFGAIAWAAEPEAGFLCDLIACAQHRGGACARPTTQG
jgi:hypothetical protein